MWLIKPMNTDMCLTIIECYSTSRPDFLIHSFPIEFHVYPHSEGILYGEKNCYLTMYEKRVNRTKHDEKFVDRYQSGKSWFHVHLAHRFNKINTKYILIICDTAMEN